MVSLNKVVFSMKVGESETLIATVWSENLYDKVAVWKSSDNSVAKVVDGKVTALKAGEAVITVTVSTASATCRITVTEGIAVTSVSLNQTSLSLEVGDIKTITATVLPSNAIDKSLTWESSDETIAIVDNGKINAIKAGLSKITATVGGITASCEVLVSNKTFENLVLESQTYIYDGTAKNLTISNLPHGAEVIYQNNGQTEAGVYIVTATVSMPDYNTVTLKEKLIINKRELEIDFVGETNLVYSGFAQKTITAYALNLIDGDNVDIIITYNGEMVEAGNYVATANIIENNNYKLSVNNTIDIVITRAEHSIIFRQKGFNDKVFKVLDLADFIDIPKPQEVAGYTVSWEEVDLNSVTCDITVKAIFDIIEYSITYELNGGIITLSNPESYTVEDNDIVLKNPIKAHYNFICWECNNKTVNKIAVSQAQNLTITAKWQPINYSIAYDLNGGTATNPTTHTVESEDIIVSMPIKNGYTFMGWTGSNGEVPEKDLIINAGNTENLSYTANWDLIVYNIDYELNGGTNALKNPSTYTILDTIELKEANKEGYTFNGWFSDHDFKNKVTTLFGLYGNLTLYAKLTPNTYKSTFITGTYKINLFYWENSSLNKAFEITNGESFAPYSLSTPTRSGYRFEGWFLDKDFTLPFIKTVEVAEDYNLYAKWATNSHNDAIELTTHGISISAYYRVGMYSNGLYYRSEDSNTNVTTYFYVPYNYSGKSRVNYSSRTTLMGNDFLSGTGSYVLKDLSGGIIRTKSYNMTNNSSSSDSPDIELIPGHYYSLNCTAVGKIYSTAKSALSCSTSVSISGVTIVKNNSLFKVNSANKLNQTYNEKSEIPIVDWRGFDFTGWYDENNEPINEIWKYTSDKTFHAGWKLHDYSINYNLNGGFNDSTNSKTYNLESEDIILQDSVKTGYTFNGWYTEPDFINQIFSINATDCKDYELYAKWTANNYTLTFDYCGGQNCPTIKFYDNEALIKEHVLFKGSTLNYFVPANTNKNYVFGGWYKDSEYTELFNFSGIVNADLTLYAKWVDVSDSNNALPNSSTAVEIKGNTNQYLSIVLPVTQSVTIMSFSGLDLYCEIFNSKWEKIGCNDDISDKNLDFAITITLEAGQIYYIGYRANQASVTGTAKIIISEIETSALYITGEYTEEIESTIVAFGEQFTLPNPKKEGYEFDGWYDDDGNLIDTTVWNYNKNLTAYAYWVNII